MTQVFGTREEIRSVLLDVVDELGFYWVPADVPDDADLFDELGFDSLDLVDLLTELEKLSPVSVQLAWFEGVRTVGELIDVFASHA